MRGTLLLNSSGAVVGFVPDDSTYETIEVSSVSANSITSSTGKKYSLASGAGVIVYGDYKTWELGFADVYAGCTARIFYSDSGTVELVYVSSASTSSTVYIAKHSVSNADNPFETAFNLTHGQYNIVKNGAAATVDDLAQYDVATFDATTNTLRVSDYRVTGTWQTAYPSADAPTKVTVMGHEFPVLESARDSFAKLKTGSQITLLLTSDLQVAAAYSASTVKATQQIGILQSVQDETATVSLTNGVSVSGKLVSSASEASRMIGALVSVSSSGTGLYLTGLDYDGTRSTWNVSSRTLGSTLLSPYVQIYERVNGGVARKISESSVLVSSVSATDIEYVSYNAQGKVSMMVVSDVTGDAYTYGMAKTGEQTVSSETLSGSNQTISVINADGQSEALVTSKKFTSGSFIGITASTNGKLAGYAALTKAGGISRDAFTGEDYVKVGKNQIPIADDVQVYNTATATWTSLAVAKAYPVAAVDVDKTIQLVKDLVAELSTLVVVHRADEDHQFLDGWRIPVRPGRERPCPQHGKKPLAGLDKLRHILRFHPEHGGIPLRQHLCLVFPKVSRCEVLAHKVLFFHDISVTDDKADRPFQRVQKPIQMRRDMPAGASGSQHDDLHRPVL